MTPAQLLDAGVADLGLSLPQGATAKLLRYLELLQKWNKVYNLTAVREPIAMVGQHLLDSLAVLPHLQATPNLADIGSGAGLPGIPLAIARGETEISLVEAVGKKASFLEQARIELGLSNVSIYCGRVEDWPRKGSIAAIISRAFSDLTQYVQLAGSLLRPGGRAYAMKGLLPATEIEALPAPWHMVAAPRLQIPGVPGQRHLVILERY